LHKMISIFIDERGVATITLERAEKHNALCAQMLDELKDAVTNLSFNKAVRVVVLTGAGESFCAGGDLEWMREQIQANSATRVRAAAKLAHTLQALNTMPKPLIGALQGNAFGGGVGLAAVCDIAIGVDHLKMGFTETRLGLIPATIGPYVLARMSEGVARRVFMSSRIFKAKEAFNFGLLSAIVPAEKLDIAVESEIGPFLSCAPGAVASAKALMRDLGPRIDDKTIAMTIDALRLRWECDEAVEGIDAFFEKRKASWAL